MISTKEWWQANKILISNQVFDIDGGIVGDESIAKALNRIRNTDDYGEDDAVADALFGYYESHSMSFAFRGVRVKDVIIGLKDDIGEVSLDLESESWSYNYNMQKFIENFDREILKLDNKSK